MSGLSAWGRGCRGSGGGSAYPGAAWLRSSPALPGAACGGSLPGSAPGSAPGNGARSTVQAPHRVHVRLQATQHVLHAVRQLARVVLEQAEQVRRDRSLHRELLLHVEANRPRVVHPILLRRRCGGRGLCGLCGSRLRRGSALGGRRSLGPLCLRCGGRRLLLGHHGASWWLQGAYAGSGDMAAPRCRRWSLSGTFCVVGFVQNTECPLFKPRRCNSGSRHCLAGRLHTPRSGGRVTLAQIPQAPAAAAAVRGWQACVCWWLGGDAGTGIGKDHRRRR